MSDELRLTFWEHIDELRKRLIHAILAVFVAMVAGWIFKEQMLAFMTAPFFEAWASISDLPPPTLHFASPIEPFVAYLKLAFVAGIFLASPYVLYQIWMFVSPGLYTREKRLALPFVLTSSLLFIGGGAMAYLLVFPIGFGYFLGFSGQIDAHAMLVPTIMMNDYLDLAMKMLFGFAIIFELPVFLSFLSIAGIVNYRQLLRFGRWFMVIAFVIGALLTPPDLISQCCMAVPLVALYFLSVLFAYLFGPRPAPETRE